MFESVYFVFSNRMTFLNSNSNACIENISQIELLQGNVNRYVNERKEKNVDGPNMYVLMVVHV